MKKLLLNGHGLSLVELLAAMAILLPICGICLLAFIKCIELSDLAKNSNIAVYTAKNRLAAVETTAFNNISTNFNNTVVAVNELKNGNITTYVNNVTTTHLDVKVVVCWKERTGRVIGEDTNTNGALDAGEDKDGDLMLSSIVQMTTRIYNM